MKHKIEMNSKELAFVQSLVAMKITEKKAWITPPTNDVWSGSERSEIVTEIAEAETLYEKLQHC